MKYIAARTMYGGYIYFQDNVNDSPKWTGVKSKAKQFDTKEEALNGCDKSGIYTGTIILVEIHP